MKLTQAWGWLAAGVLALGLNGIYHDGGAAWAHRTIDDAVAQIAERTGPVLALATGRADLLMAKTNMLAARSETASCRMGTEVAQVQTSLLRRRRARMQESMQARIQEKLDEGSAQFERISAREEEAMARLEENRARIEDQVARVHVAPAAFDTVISCPRVRVRVPQIHVSVPAVDVEVGAHPM